MFTVSDAWKDAYPAAAVGILAMCKLSNPKKHAALATEKAKLEASLREQYGEMDRPTMRALPILQAYHQYYKRFKKSYHVQLQLESIAHKGKSIPRVAALVEAMFMAELKNGLLTAGHDLDILEPPVSIQVADGTESYTRMNGQPQTLKAGDMYIADAQGILSSIIYGPDRRSAIRPETTRAIFTVYAPAGIEIAVVEQHLQNMRAYALLIAPEAQVELEKVFTAD